MSPVPPSSKHMMEPGIRIGSSRQQKDQYQHANHVAIAAASSNTGTPQQVPPLYDFPNPSIPMFRASCRFSISSRVTELAFLQLAGLARSYDETCPRSCSATSEPAASFETETSGLRAPAQVCLPRKAIPSARSDRRVPRLSLGIGIGGGVYIHRKDSVTDQEGPCGNKRAPHATDERQKGHTPGSVRGTSIAQCAVTPDREPSPPFPLPAVTSGGAGDEMARLAGTDCRELADGWINSQGWHTDSEGHLRHGVTRADDVAVQNEPPWPPF